MLIVCPSCESEFAIDPELLRPNGRKLRCANCRDVFFIDAPDDDAMMDPDDPVAASLARRMRGEEMDGPEIAVEAENLRPATAASARGPRAGIPARLAGGLVAAFAGLAAGFRRLPVTPILAMLLVGIVIGALIGRESVVRRLPATAGLYEMAGMSVNLRGLELVEVSSERTREDDGEYLTVYGTIVNRTDRSHMVPPVAVILRAQNGQSVYSWSVEADRRTLHPGENVSFRARLVAPPPEARQVLVRFAPTADLAGGRD
ncbi:MAG: zinc-ribbon domain-containing protein [Salinarimonas sp.]|nr:zinc-ribbon domain-containing protein [Salinarimonas sp.]